MTTAIFSIRLFLWIMSVNERGGTNIERLTSGTATASLDL
jgi:hypothetical protein